MDIEKNKYNFFIKIMNYNKKLVNLKIKIISLPENEEKEKMGMQIHKARTNN